jgi:hypothetical protein
MKPLKKGTLCWLVGLGGHWGFFNGRVVEIEAAVDDCPRCGSTAYFVKPTADFPILNMAFCRRNLRPFSDPEPLTPAAVVEWCRR